MDEPEEGQGPGCNVWQLGVKAAAPGAQILRGRLERLQEGGFRTLGAQRARVLGLGRRLRAAARGSPRLPPLTSLPLDAPSDVGLLSDGASSCGSSLHSGDASCSSSASTGLGTGGASGSSRGSRAQEDAPTEQVVDGVLVKQPEDGSCLFHSIAYGLGDGTKAEKLRSEIAAFIGEKPSLQIANTTIKEWVRLTAGMTPHAYTQELRDRGTWGGALEMAVAAQIKGVNIDVYERHEFRYRRITSFSNPSATSTVTVVYRTKPCRHYDALSLAASPTTATTPSP